MECERILVRVGGGVVGLTAVARDADERGEHDEEIHVRRKTRVQVPASLDFGRHDSLPILGRHVFEGGVVEVHRALNDAADRREVRCTRGDDLLELAAIANVALVDADVDTLAFQIRNERCGVSVLCS